MTVGDSAIPMKGKAVLCIKRPYICSIIRSKHNAMKTASSNGWRRFHCVVNGWENGTSSGPAGSAGTRRRSFSNAKSPFGQYRGRDCAQKVGRNVNQGMGTQQCALRQIFRRAGSKQSISPLIGKKTSRTRFLQRPMACINPLIGKKTRPRLRRNTRQLVLIP